MELLLQAGHVPRTLVVRVQVNQTNNNPQKETIHEIL